MPPAEAVSSVREQAASQPPHIDGKPPKARGSLQRKQDTARFRRKERRQDGGTAIKSTVQDNPATGGRGGEQFGLPKRRSDTRVSTRATGDHTRIEALSGNFCNGILLFKIEKSHFNSAWSGPATRPGLVQTFVSCIGWSAARANSHLGNRAHVAVSAHLRRRATTVGGTVVAVK